MPHTSLVVVIDRARLARRVLRDSAGCMCPVGFLCVACGVPPDLLVGLTFPPDDWVQVPVGFRTSGGVWGNSARRVSDISDDDALSVGERERLVVEEFVDDVRQAHGRWIHDRRRLT